MAKQTPFGTFGRAADGISTVGWMLRGAAAGAAGTTALDAVTYLDMAGRGRPARRTPEQSGERVGEGAPLRGAGDHETRGNRLQGLGPLLGILTGVTVGAAYGLVHERLG